MRVILSITEGPGPRKKFWLREHQSLTVGRTQRADFEIGEDGLISSLHFKLVCDDSSCRISDLESTNGTFVNNERIAETLLSDGDLVVAGRTHFAVTVEADRVKRPPQKSTPADKAQNAPVAAPAPPVSEPQQQPAAGRRPVRTAKNEPQVSAKASGAQEDIVEPAASPDDIWEPLEREAESDIGTPIDNGKEAEVWEPIADAKEANVWEPIDEADPKDVWQPPDDEPRNRPSPAAVEVPSAAPVEHPAEIEEPPPPLPEQKLEPQWDDEVFLQLLADAGFLYTKRKALLDDTTIQWLELEETEQRFEAQIGGLLVGGERATAICVQQSLIEGEGDPGILYAATQFFLRQRRRDLFDHVVARLDKGDALQVMAVADAVRDAYPEEWMADLQQELKAGSARLVLATSKLIGLRKCEATGGLIRAAATANVDALPQMNWALGRQRNYDAHDVLMHSLQTHGAPDVQSSSAVAMLCLGAPHVVKECLSCLGDDDWPFVPLGLGADHQAVSYLINRIEANPHPDGFLALGMLGHMSAVNVIWAALADDELAAAAAEALYLLTGAELWEEAEEAEEAEEEQPADSEPAAAGGDEEVEADPIDPAEDTVVLITRLSQNQGHWQQWWRRNRDRFSKDKRYRYGREYGPDQLVDMLESGQTSHRLRQLAYEELVIRYNLDSPFDTDLFVASQRRALRKIDDWVRSYGSRFQPGLWYFAGQAM